MLTWIRCSGVSTSIPSFTLPNTYTTSVVGAVATRFWGNPTQSTTLIVNVARFKINSVAVYTNISGTDHSACCFIIGY